MSHFLIRTDTTLEALCHVDIQLHRFVRFVISFFFEMLQIKPFVSSVSALLICLLVNTCLQKGNIANLTVHKRKCKLSTKHKLT